MRTNHERSDISLEVHDVNRIQKQRLPRPVMGQSYQVRMLPGIYDLDEDFSLGDYIPNSKSLEMNSDEIYVFRDENSKTLQEEIYRFWKSGSIMESNGLLHKRGIIIDGPPASGKSSLIKQEMKKLSEQNKQIIFYSRSPYQLQRVLRDFREKEPNRPVTVVMEDIDEIASGWGMHGLLELLDGANAINHVLYIATTNNIASMPEKLKRPGRFDRKIHVPNPNAQLRQEYIQRKFGSFLNETQVRNIVEQTDGLSFGHLREIVVSHKGYKVPLAECIKRLKSEVLIERSGESTKDVALSNHLMKSLLE